MDKNMAPGLRENPVPGTEVQLGTFTYVMPPMLLEHIRKAFTEGLMDKLAKLMGPEGGLLNKENLDALDAVETLCLWSLQRNYPTTTLDDVKAVLDVGNQQMVTQALFSLNRLTARPTLPAADPAVPPAATPANGSSGVTSSVH